MNAVGADHKVGLAHRAVGENEPDARRSFLKTDQLMIEMNSFGIDAARQDLQKIGAMEGVNAGAKAGRSRRLVAIVERRAGIHVAGEHAGRDVGDGRDPLAKPDRAQRFDGLRTDVDAGANLAELQRLLEDLHLEAEAGERGGSRQTGQAAADDGNTNLGHGPLTAAA